jgi:uncharacterized membrane protein
MPRRWAISVTKYGVARKKEKSEPAREQTTTFYQAAETYHWIDSLIPVIVFINLIIVVVIIIVVVVLVVVVAIVIVGRGFRQQVGPSLDRERQEQYGKWMRKFEWEPHTKAPLCSF